MPSKPAAFLPPPLQVSSPGDCLAYTARGSLRRTFLGLECFWIGFVFFPASVCLPASQPQRTAAWG